MDKEKFFDGLVSKGWEHILYFEDKNDRKVAFKTIGKTNQAAHHCYVAENAGPWKALNELDIFQKTKTGYNKSDK